MFVLCMLDSVRIWGAFVFARRRYNLKNDPNILKKQIWALP